MEVEKIATSTVTNEIAKTDRLSSFINSGDKEPCWDGHIYIHQDKTKTKKGIKKVATQIKGKLVRPRAVNRTINYSISYDDLYAYMMNGGTMFFVVYIDDKTGDVLQIYYAALLPVQIKEFFNAKKNKYSIKFRKFPTDKLQKTEIFINFYDDSRKQASFAGRDLPTIDELTEKGVLESLTISYTGLGEYDSQSAFPKMLEGKPLTIYANIKGGTVPVPVEYIDSVSHFTMSNESDIPVSVNGKVYYPGIHTITTADIIEHNIGTSAKIVVPNTGKKNDTVPMTFNFSLKGTLSEQIASMEFICAAIEHGSFCLGKANIPINFTQEALDRINAQEYPSVLKGYKRLKEVLDSMNVKKDLEIGKCTEEDMKNLNLLIGTIGDQLPVKGKPDNPANVQKMTIANLTLALVYLNKDDDSYCIFDYFGNYFEVTWAPKGAEPAVVSQFFSMGVDDYLMLDNLNLQTIVDDFKRVELSPQHLDLANDCMLTMLKAYDKKPSLELLNAAKQMVEWLQAHHDFTSENIITLNSLQIALRERDLTFHEKSKLFQIATQATDPLHQIGAFLLLGEHNEAKNIIESLNDDDSKLLKSFPIYRFYKYAEEESDNGQAEDAHAE